MLQQALICITPDTKPHNLELEAYCKSVTYHNNPAGEWKLKLSFTLNMMQEEAMARGCILPSFNQYERRDGLWQSTCFECFIKPIGSDCYWEINITPSGAWNVYYFTGYRQGMEAALAHCEQIDIKYDDDNYRVCAELSSPSWRSLYGKPCYINLTAVMESSKGLSYWALKDEVHPPDFHACAGFKESIL